MTTRFALRQQIGAPLAAVEAAFVDPDFYVMLARLPNLDPPQVLMREVEGDVVRLRVRYRFTGDLSAAARAVLDPNRLTWIDESEHDLANHAVAFDMLADHYADRFTCRGRYWFEAVDGGTERHAEGEVTVRAPLVGRAVERAIVSGLQRHLQDEVDIVEDFLAPDR